MNITFFVSGTTILGRVNFKIDFEVSQVGGNIDQNTKHNNSKGATEAWSQQILFYENVESSCLKVYYSKLVL